jgi:hypothetical protein
MRTLWTLLRGVPAPATTAPAGGTAGAGTAAAGPNAPAPGPSAEEQNKSKNVEEGARQFGSTGARFNKLTGAGDLNTRQKQIFDAKLKQAIEKDPRARAGPLSEADLKALAQQAADVTNKLARTTFSDDINKLSLKSETLKTNIVELQNDGWTIKPAEPGKGDRTDRPSKTITIDASIHPDTKGFVESLAHETGHGRYAKPADPPVDDPSPTVAKGREYIRKVVENSLLDEGEAQVVACETAKELEAKSETGINIPGTNSAKYKAVYDKIVAGTLSRGDGRKEMAKIMATETTSGSPPRNYVAYYSDWPRDNWNGAHADAQVPETPLVTVFP